MTIDLSCQIKNVKPKRFLKRNIRFLEHLIISKIQLIQKVKNYINNQKFIQDFINS